MSYRDSEVDMTDAGMAAALIADLGGDWIYVADAGQWMEWQGAKWDDDQTEAILQRSLCVAEALEAYVDSIEDEKIKKAARRSWLGRMSATALAAAVRVARTDPDIATLAKHLDADGGMLHTPTGCVDLVKSMALPPDRRWMNTRTTRVPYDPQARSEAWEKFLQDVTCGDESMQTWLQQAVGMTLLGDQREQVVIFCHGIGANGKTTFLEAVSHALGDYSAQGAPDLVTASHNDRHPTELYDLRGRRMVVVPELRGNKALDESKLKMLSSGGSTKGRAMGKDFVEFPNTWQLWLDGNARPTIHGQDEGIWRRIRLVPWRLHLTPDRRDRTLGQKLRDDAPAILAWAVRGCEAYLKAGKLPECAAIDQGTNDYRLEQDMVGAWLADIHAVQVWTPDPSHTAPAAAVMASATQWCEAQNLRPWTPQRLAQELRQRGCIQERKANGRLWTGIDPDAVSMTHSDQRPQYSWANRQEH